MRNQLLYCKALIQNIYIVLCLGNQLVLFFIFADLEVRLDSETQMLEWRQVEGVNFKIYQFAKDFSMRCHVSQISPWCNELFIPQAVVFDYIPVV